MPRRACLGELSPCSARMKQSEATRYEKFSQDTHDFLRSRACASLLLNILQHAVGDQEAADRVDGGAGHGDGAEDGAQRAVARRRRPPASRPARCRRWRWCPPSAACAAGGHALDDVVPEEACQHEDVQAHQQFVSHVPLRVRSPLGEGPVGCASSMACDSVLLPTRRRSLASAALPCKEWRATLWLAKRRSLSEYAAATREPDCQRQATRRQQGAQPWEADALARARALKYSITMGSDREGTMTTMTFST